MNRSSIVTFIVCLFLVACSSTTLYASDPCDRACLEKHIDKVLGAMIAYNPNQLMLARDVYYTENGVEMRLGDGLWGTLSGRGKYSLYSMSVILNQVRQVCTGQYLKTADWITLHSE